MDTPAWWTSPKGEAHESVFEYVRALEEEQDYLHEENIWHARLYANCDLLGLDWTVRGRQYGRKPLAGEENVICSVIDTAASMIAKNRPRATFLTDGADFTAQRRAKLLERFVEGLFHRLNVYDVAADVFRDACIFGTGVVKVFRDGNDIKLERCLIDDIIVDEMECRTGNPRQLHHRCFVDREVLKADFPKHANAIELANKNDRQYVSYRQVQDNQVVVIESWHLPSGPGADDGRHTICLDNVTLQDKKWSGPSFPFRFYHWSKPVVGFYGQGLAAQLTGIQLRINKLNKFIAACQDLISTPRIFVDVASKTLKAHITNQIGAIIPYRGKPPIFLTPQAISNDVYQYKETLKRSAYEFAGISQLTASSKKPQDVESGAALRELNNIETERFSIQAQRYESLHLEIAKMLVEISREIHGDGGRVVSVFSAKNLVQKIEWDQVELDEDKYSLSIEAAGILSRLPAGRKQDVMDWAQAGLIDTDEARRLLGHSDLERTKSLANAAIEDIEATIEELLDGKQPVPEPYQDLQQGLRRVQMAYLKARHENAPEDILEAMRQWMSQAEGMLNPPAPPVPATPADPAAPPPMPVDPAMATAGPMDPAGGQPTAALAPEAMQLIPT